MSVSEEQRRLLALCAIRTEQGSVDWSLIAREAQFPDGLEALWQGKVQETGESAERAREALRQGVGRRDELFRRVDKELAAAEGVHAKLITVLDESYPANLRLIPNLPPFLFVRGEVLEDDARSVAVVGTRIPSDLGIGRAEKMTRGLVAHGVTVISGLARGIDAVVHRTALASSGRTLAVLGTGITQCYPPEHRDLAEEISRQGALVSQFWPTRPPGKDTFPRRNVVTSGLSQGTVVIEATSTSGAKTQARLALEHGKKVFLVTSLVTDQPWAAGYVRKRGAIEVSDVGEVLDQLASPERVRQVGEQRQQLSLALL
ncbi:MAG: DNA-processing protein DprA [Candidatus Dormiibacterota bacterium]